MFAATAAGQARRIVTAELPELRGRGSGVVVSLFLVVFAAWEIALPADEELVSPFHPIGLMPLRIARSGIDGIGARELSADSSLGVKPAASSGKCPGLEGSVIT